MHTSVGKPQNKSRSNTKYLEKKKGPENKHFLAFHTAYIEVETTERILYNTLGVV